MPDGDYTYLISAVDEGGNTTEFTGMLTASSSRLGVADLVAEPARISPADTNHQFDLTTIRYRLSKTAKVTIQVFRDSTALVAANLVDTLLTADPQAAGGHTITWDGRDRLARPVSPGQERRYRIVVSAFDEQSGETSQSSTTVMVDNRPPQLLALDRLASWSDTALIAVTGRTDPGSLVWLLLNGQLADSLHAPDFGLFRFELDLGADGLKTIAAAAYDSVGNGPILSDTLRLVLDTRAPLAVDTLARLAGTARSLQQGPLPAFGPGDTLELRFSDGAGRVSGIDLATASLEVQTPGGAQLEGAFRTRSPGTLLFTPLVPATEPGIYLLRATVADSAGNRAVLAVSFSLGEGGLPAQITLTPQEPWLNSRLQSAWTFSATVQEQDPPRIDLAASSLELVYLPGSRTIPGTIARQGNQLSLTIAAGQVASDTSMNGIFELRLRLEHATLGTVSSTARYLNDTRRPDTLAFRADSALVVVSLRDQLSGIDLAASGLEVFLNGATVPAGLTNDGDSTLRAEFDPPLTAAGVYTVTVDIQDRAGNQRTRELYFVVGGAGVVPELVDVTPPFDSGLPANSAAVGQPLQATVEVRDRSGTGIDWQRSTLVLLGPDSLAIPGALTPVPDQNAINYLTDRVLSNGGQDDGRYRLLLHVADLRPETADLDTALSFIYDNLAPDTAAVEFPGDSSTLRIRLADPSPAPGREMAGVEILACLAAVSGPGGAAVTAVLVRADHQTLELRFEGGKPPAAGRYLLTVTAADRAGNTRVCAPVLSPSMSAAGCCSSPPTARWCAGISPGSPPGSRMTGARWSRARRPP